MEACLAVLGEKVVYLVIGTHSRQIEGRSLAVLPEIEHPCIMMFGGEAPFVAVNCVQG